MEYQARSGPHPGTSDRTRRVMLHGRTLRVVWACRPVGCSAVDRHAGPVVSSVETSIGPGSRSQSSRQQRFESHELDEQVARFAERAPSVPSSSHIDKRDPLAVISIRSTWPAHRPVRFLARSAAAAVALRCEIAGFEIDRIGTARSAHRQRGTCRARRARDRRRRAPGTARRAPGRWSPPGVHGCRSWPRAGSRR